MIKRVGNLTHSFFMFFCEIINDKKYLNSKIISTLVELKTIKLITMLELTKKVLKKVSFDAKLFQKELNKALKWINDTEEITKFKQWCIIEFGSLYPLIIKEAFERKAIV
ncbi:MAG: hypothetical protein M9916_00990 [Crocinitomicaceae bacterium]|nr:hypothetical protein [Crocinitomicaceae bacterium]